MKSSYQLKTYKKRMKHAPTQAEQQAFANLSIVYEKEDIKNQVILGFYILDFVVLPKLLVIEVDGSSHDDKKSYDLKRDNFINLCGLRVLHIKNEDVDTLLYKVNQYNDVDNYIKKFRSSLSRANNYRGQALTKLS